MKIPVEMDAKQHYHKPHHSNEKNGTYKRASCAALNTLANKGLLPRTRRNVIYESMAQSMQDVFNFGDDNVFSTISLWSAKSYPILQIVVVLVPAFELHRGAASL